MTGGGEHSAGHQPQSQVIAGEVEATEPGGWWEGKTGLSLEPWASDVGAVGADG